MFSTRTFFENSSIFSNNSHRLCVVVRSLAARSVYETYYYKMVTFQPRFWVENPFGVMIFGIFWFKKNALFMGVLLVLKKISSDILKCVNTLNWRSASKHCIWYIITLDFGWKTPWGQNIQNFSLPETSPRHGELNGEKISKFRLPWWNLKVFGEWIN